MLLSKTSTLFSMASLLPAMGYALERKIRFLGEQHTEPYIEYGEGVAQAKNGFSAKSTLQSRALLDLERYGA